MMPRENTWHLYQIISTYAQATSNRAQNPAKEALQEILPVLAKIVEEQVRKALSVALKNTKPMRPPTSTLPIQQPYQEISDFDNVSIISDTMSQLSEKRKRDTRVSRNDDSVAFSDESSASQIDQPSRTKKKKGWPRGKPRKPVEASQSQTGTHDTGGTSCQNTPGPAYSAGQSQPDASIHL
nr:unnamed protein product [Callosobruchus chinensis]